MFYLRELLQSDALKNAFQNARTIDVQARSLNGFPLEFFQSGADHVRVILPNILSPNIKDLEYEDDYDITAIRESYDKIPHKYIKLDPDGVINYFYLAIMTRDDNTYMYVGTYLKAFADLECPIAEIDGESFKIIYYGDFCTRSAMGVPLTQIYLDNLSIP